MLWPVPMETLLPWHDLKANKLRAWFTYPLGQQQSMVVLVVIKTLSLWQERNALSFLVFEAYKLNIRHKCLLK